MQHTNDFDSVVFDLDGTLWDTCATCAIGWNAVLARHGIPFRAISVEDVRRVMGKPHEQCIRETFAGLPEDQLRVLVDETMREDNAIVERLGGELYPGVKEGLHRLSERYRLCIVSNCQSGYIETFLKFGGVETAFLDFECWGNTRRPKANNLANLIARNSLARPVMVGDMESDAEAARQCGIPFFFVRYGFGTASSYRRAFESFEQLRAELLREG